MITSVCRTEDSSMNHIPSFLRIVKTLMIGKTPKAGPVGPELHSARFGLSKMIRHNGFLMSVRFAISPLICASSLHGSLMSRPSTSCTYGNDMQDVNKKAERIARTRLCDIGLTRV